MKSWLPSFFRGARKGAPAVFLALILLPFLLGCLAGVGERPTPTRVSLGGGSARPVSGEFIPGVHRYTDDSSRLVFPTETPIPTPTVRPTPDFSRLALPTVTPVLPEASVEPEFPEGLSCVQQYRLMLVNYDGRAPFGLQVAYDLSESLKEYRPECLTQGWNPVFNPSVVCTSGSVAKVRLTSGLTRRLTSGSKPQALATTRDSSGNMLIHFTRLPMEHARGCWYYRSDDDAWAWVVDGGGFGVDLPRFPACDGLLQELLASLPAHEFSMLEIARMLDEVRLLTPEDCSSPLWGLFPDSGSHEDCGVPGDTGLTDDGVFVVTWNEEYPPSDYAVCWVLRPSANAWEFFYEVEEELPDSEAPPVDESPSEPETTGG